MANAVVGTHLNLYASAKNASTAATGSVLSYTVPANKTAEVTSWFCDRLNAAAAASPQLTLGGGTFRPESTVAAGTNSRRFGTQVHMGAGDVAEWIVTTAVLATTADFYLSIGQEA